MTQESITFTFDQAVIRSKTAFVFLIGGSRLALPFHAFQDDAQIDKVDAAIKNWMEASR